MRLEKQNAYLQSQVKIYCLRNLDSNVLISDTDLEGWIPRRVQIWRNEKNARKWNIFQTSSPVFTYVLLVCLIMIFWR